MKIHLSCSDCGGDLTYEKKTEVDAHEAHEKLHKNRCPWRALMTWPEMRVRDPKTGEVKTQKAMLYLTEKGEYVLDGNSERAKHSFPDRRISLDVLASRDVPVCSEQVG